MKLNLKSNSFDYKKNFITQFKVENYEKIKWFESLIFFIFIIFVPIFWVALRSLIYPNYLNDFTSGNNTNYFKTFYSLSVFLFQIGFPLIGMVILSFTMKSRFIKSSLIFFFLLFPCRTIISLIISNFTSQITGLNSFIIDFLYSFIVIGFFIFKNKRFQKMIKISFLNNKNILITFFYIALFFGIAYLLQFSLTQISLNISSSSSSLNQGSISSKNVSSFGIASIFFASVIAAPIVEEICFRLIFQDTFNNKISGYLLNILFFAFLHIQIYGDWVWIFPYFSLGIVSGLIYYKFKNITIPISIHFLINFISFIAMIK